MVESETEKKVLLLVLYIVAVITPSFSVQAKSTPSFVLFTVIGGRVFPEIAVTGNGKYRQAQDTDMWTGQKINIYSFKSPNRFINTVYVQSIKGSYGYFKDASLMPNEFYIGVFRRKPFVNKGLGKIFKPVNISRALNSQFHSGKNTKVMLKNILKYDKKAILKDYPQIKNFDLAEFMSGDFNGDKKKDYILVLNAYPEGAAIIIYISEEDSYKRVNIIFWEGASYSTVWPRFFFSIDLNGDGSEEICITESDSNINIPIIYAWFKEKGGFMMVYKGEVELWSGE